MSEYSIKMTTDISLSDDISRSYGKADLTSEIKEYLPTKEEEVCLHTTDKCAVCSRTGETDLWTGVLERGRDIPKVSNIKVLNLPFYRLIGKIGSEVPREIHNGTIYDLFALGTCIRPLIFSIDERLDISFGEYRTFRPVGGWKMGGKRRRRRSPPSPPRLQELSYTGVDSSEQKSSRRKIRGKYVMRFILDLTMSGKVIYPAEDIRRRIQRAINSILRTLPRLSLIIDPQTIAMSERSAPDLIFTSPVYPARYLDPETGNNLLPDVENIDQKDDITVPGESVFVSEMLSIIPYLCVGFEVDKDVEPPFINFNPENMFVKEGRLYAKIEGLGEPEDVIRKGYMFKGDLPYMDKYEALREAVISSLEWLRSNNAVLVDDPTSEEGKRYIQSWMLTPISKRLWKVSDVSSNIFISEWKEDRIGSDLRGIIRGDGDMICVKLPFVRTSDESHLSDEEWILLPPERNRVRDLLKDLIPYQRHDSNRFTIIDNHLLFSCSSSSSSAREISAIVDLAFSSWER